MMMGFGFLGMLLLGGVLLAFVVGAAILVFRQTTDTRPLGGPGQPTARQVLDERFARGEIDREEYEAIRARIEQ
jgi:putative membrane protein